MTPGFDVRTTGASNASPSAALAPPTTADASARKTTAVESVKAYAKETTVKASMHVKLPAVQAMPKTLEVEPAASVPAVEPRVKLPAVETTAHAAAGPAPPAGSQNAASTTITGCLESNGDGFRLKDTAGLDAPRSRSWRSGFLKSRPSPIELLDETSALSLSQYVGSRVAATGVLVDREMRAHSLKPIVGTCD
jgi:hypothetical protein